MIRGFFNYIIRPVFEFFEHRHLIYRKDADNHYDKAIADNNKGGQNRVAAEKFSIYKPAIIQHHCQEYGSNGKQAGAEHDNYLHRQHTE